MTAAQQARRAHRAGVSRTESELGCVSGDGCKRQPDLCSSLTSDTVAAEARRVSNTTELLLRRRKIGRW